MTTATGLHESGHAKRVLQRIHERIADAGGWLAFDQFMQIALYEPGLGYYSAGAHKLGAHGDFTTAPELSPLFGQCLAKQADAVLTAIGGGDILEIGAGSGRLAFDVLRAMEANERAPQRYRILEISADLRERQRALIATLPADLAARVEWLDKPPQSPWQGMVLANEVFDALPFQRFVKLQGVLHALGVALDAGGKLHWQPRAADAALQGTLRGLALTDDLPEGYTSEVCVLLKSWLAEVTASLQRGVALFVDYGVPRRDYYSAVRQFGTLRCHHRHTAHDNPFAHPGMEDITAWVDFTLVAEGADACGLDVLGYATQTGALLSLGIEQLLATCPDEATRIRRASEAMKLLMPTEMGETFKFIALGRDYDAPLDAFLHQDQRERL